MGETRRAGVRYCGLLFQPHLLQNIRVQYFEGNVLIPAHDVCQTLCVTSIMFILMKETGSIGLPLVRIPALTPRHLKLLSASSPRRLPFLRAFSRIDVAFQLGRPDQKTRSGAYRIGDGASARQLGSAWREMAVALSKANPLAGGVRRGSPLHPPGERRILDL